MPAGRPVNYDAKIKRLVAELRKALVAREAARIEGAVASHIDGLVASLQSGIDIGGSRQAVTASPVASADARPVPAGPNTKRKGRSAASRKAQAAKMKAYWKARKAAEAKADTTSKTATSGKAASRQ